MEIKIGSVATVRNELAEEITGDKINNKFLITALTDYSVTIRSLGDNRTHSLRVDVFANNVKWYGVPESQDRPVKTAQPAAAPQEPVAPEPEPDSDTSVDTSDTNTDNTADEPAVFTVKPVVGGKARIVRASALTSFVTNTQEEDPYGSDPYADLYNG